MKRCNEGIAVAVLATATLAAYANSLGGAFQFDDYNVIVDYPVVHSWQAWLANLGHGLRPLLKLTYLLNWLSGWGAPGFHAVNLLIHCTNALLVMFLARRYLAARPPGQEKWTIPLVAALLFAVHPVQTEAVTYICGRSASLMTLFSLGALAVHAAADGKHERLARWLAVPLLFAAAIACKETAITLPPALLLWDLCEGRTWRSICRRQWPVWLTTLTITITLVKLPAYRSILVNSMGLHNLTTNVLTTFTAFFYLLGKWLWPLHLNIDPDLAVVRNPAEALPQMAGVILLCSAAWLARRKRPWLTLAIGWLVLQLVPLYLLVPRQDIANERQLYPAAVFLFVALAIELSYLPPRWSKAVVAVLLTGCCLLTVQRNKVYKNEISLWENTVKLSPNKARVHNNLGYAYMLAGREEKARQQYMAALAIDPSFFLARNNLKNLAKEE